MKLSQLMLAGDYLSYKGDWATNTAYNVNDVVTWSTDGHLYEIIKAHTSSSTIDPSNAEYYKAMTARKVLSKSFNNSTQLFNFLESIQYQDIKYLEIVTGGVTFKLQPQTNKTTYSCTVVYASDGAIRHVLLSIYSTSVTGFFVDVELNGTRTKTNMNITRYTIYYEK